MFFLFFFRFLLRVLTLWSMLNMLVISLHDRSRIRIFYVKTITWTAGHLLKNTVKTDPWYKLGLVTVTLMIRILLKNTTMVIRDLKKKEKINLLSIQWGVYSIEKWDLIFSRVWAINCRNCIFCLHRLDFILRLNQNWYKYIFVVNQYVEQLQSDRYFQSIYFQTSLGFQHNSWRTGWEGKTVFSRMAQNTSKVNLQLRYRIMES